MFEIFVLIPALRWVAVVSCISMQPFHYLVMSIISLQMSQLNNVEFAVMLYKQIQPKPFLSQSIHFSLGLSWDFSLEALPHFTAQSSHCVSVPTSKS